MGFKFYANSSIVWEVVPVRKVNLKSANNMTDLLSAHARRKNTVRKVTDVMKFVISALYASMKNQLREK